MANDLEVRKSTDVAQLQELERILLGDAELPDVVDDPAEISREIMAQLLAAETDEELEAVGTATGWRDLAGVPMELHGFRWRPSNFEEGAPIFFVVNATRLDTGERVVVTTGSGNILAQLTNMARRGTLVGAVRSLEIADTQTRNGFRPNWLRTPTQAMIDASKRPEGKAAKEKEKAEEAED